MTTFFDDIDKNALDTLNKGFPSGGSFKVSADLKTGNDVTVASSATRSFKGDKESVVAVIEPKFVYAPQNLEVNAKFSTASEYSLGATLKNLAVDGSKISVTGTQKSGSNSVKAAFQFSNDTVAVKSAVTVPDDMEDQPIKADASLVTGLDNFTVGLSVNHATSYDDGVSQDSATNYGAKVAYGEPDFQVAATYTTGDKSECTASFYQVKDSVKFAAQFVYDTASKATSAVFGADYKYASDTSIKSKVSVKGSDFRTGVALSQNWTSSTTVTIAADVNALSVLGSNSGAAHSFGVEVKLQ